jgi:hypothetical protein
MCTQQYLLMRHAQHDYPPLCSQPDVFDHPSPMVIAAPSGGISTSYSA